MTNWKKYKTGVFQKPAISFWQKKILGVYVNVLEYSPHTPIDKTTFEIDFQLNEEKSPAGMTTNVKLFPYHKKDFKKFEKDAKKIIKKITL